MEESQGKFQRCNILVSDTKDDAKAVSVVCLAAQSCLILCDLLCPRGFSRQEHWSGLPCPLPGDVPNPGIKPGSPILQADSLPSEPPGKSVIVICTENNARREEEMCVRRS